MPISRFNSSGRSSSNSNRALLYDPITAVIPVPNHPNLTDSLRKYEEDPFLAKVPTFVQNFSNQLSSSAPNKYNSSSSTSVPFSHSSSISKTPHQPLIFSSDYTLYDTQLKLSTEQSINNSNNDLLRKSSSLGHIPDSVISDQAFLHNEYRNLMNNTPPIPMPISGNPFDNKGIQSSAKINNPQRRTVESMDSTISNQFSSSNSDNEFTVCSMSTNSSVNSTNRNSIGENFVSSENVATGKISNKEAPLIKVTDFENDLLQGAPNFKLRKARSATLFNDNNKHNNETSTTTRINNNDSFISQDTLETLDMAPGDLSYQQELTRTGTTNLNQRPQHFHRHSIVTYIPNSLHNEKINMPNNISFQSVINSTAENQSLSDQNNSVRNDPHTEIHSPLFPMDDDDNDNSSNTSTHSNDDDNNNNDNNSNNNNNSKSNINVNINTVNKNSNEFIQENSENDDDDDDQNLSGMLNFPKKFNYFFY